MSRDTVYSWSLRRARAQVEAEIGDPKTAETGAVSRDEVLRLLPSKMFSGQWLHGCALLSNSVLVWREQ